MLRLPPLPALRFAISSIRCKLIQCEVEHRTTGASRSARKAKRDWKAQLLEFAYFRRATPKPNARSRKQGFATGGMGFSVSLHGSNPELLMSALGQKQTSDCQLLMSALPPKAEIAEQISNVRPVPKADVWAV